MGGTERYNRLSPVIGSCESNGTCGPLIVNTFRHHHRCVETQNRSGTLGVGYVMVVHLPVGIIVTQVRVEGFGPSGEKN